MFSYFTSKLGIYRFFDDFVIIYALYTLMFQNNGLKVGEISILLAIWSITSFLLEIPSGVLADKYNRRNILIFAQGFRIAGFMLWLLFPTFWGFLFGFIFWGIKSACTSGTLDAYLYDGLRAEGKEQSYSKVLGRLKGLSFVAILLSSGLASALFFLGYKFIMLLSIASLVISMIALTSIKSCKISESTKEVKYLSLLTEGVSNVLRNSKLLILVMISSVLVGAMAVDEYFALYIREVNIPISLVGYLFASYSLVQMLASFIAYKYESNELLLPIFTIFSLIIFIVGFASSYLGVVLFMLLAFIASMGQVLSSSAIQSNSQSHVRATVSSVSSFLAEIFAFIVFIVFILLPSGEIRQGLVIYGGGVLILTLSVLILYIIKKPGKLL